MEKLAVFFELHIQKKLKALKFKDILKIYKVYNLKANLKFLLH